MGLRNLCSRACRGMATAVVAIPGVKALYAWAEYNLGTPENSSEEMSAGGVRGLATYTVHRGLRELIKPPGPKEESVQDLEAQLMTDLESNAPQPPSSSTVCKRRAHQLANYTLPFFAAAAGGALASGTKFVAAVTGTPLVYDISPETVGLASGLVVEGSLNCCKPK